MTDPAQPVPGYREDQRSFFDARVTRDWASYSNPVWDASRRFEVEQIFAHVSARTVLDVGCGCGFHDVVIADQPGVDVVDAIDYSETTIEVAEREYPHDRVRREVADILTKPDAEHDLAVSFQVIEHLRDQEAFMRACARQVRPGGHVAIATPNRLRLENRVRRLVGKDAALVAVTHFRELSRQELVDLGRRAGLQPKATFGYGLSFMLPYLERQLIPQRPAIELGSRVPAIANVVVAVFERPAAS